MTSFLRLRHAAVAVRQQQRQSRGPVLSVRCFVSPHMRSVVERCVSVGGSPIGVFAYGGGEASSSRCWFSSNPRPPSNRAVGAITALGTGAVLMASKGKYVLASLKLTKLASLGSMAVTIGTYSIFFGWPYAVGMVSLILVHECGHALVMHRLGIPFSPIVFVPFVGAAILMNRQPTNAYHEALTAFGGPVLGSMGALAVCGAAHATHSQLLFALADFGFLINLFNLIPIGTLDGGRICGALSPYAGLAGLGLGGFLIYDGYVSNPIFYLVMLGGGYHTFTRFYDPTNTAYYALTRGQRLGVAGGYVGLVAGLMAAMAVNERYKMSVQQLKRERETKSIMQEWTNDY